MCLLYFIALRSDHLYTIYKCVNVYKWSFWKGLTNADIGSAVSEVEQDTGGIVAE